MRALLVAVVAVVTLAACGETPQGNSAGKLDASPYGGTGKAFVDPDWKAGDKTSWQSHLKARAEYGQNDHSRSN